jgi:hypothetical protein
MSFSLSRLPARWGVNRSASYMRARVAARLGGDVAPTKGEAWLWLQHARNRGLDAVQRRLRPEGDSSSSPTQQDGIDVAKPEGSHPRLPASRDLRGSVDPWQHRSQPSIPKQPVERASKLRMIPSGDEAAAGLYQSIDLHMCIHAQRMRTKQPNRLVRAGSVDGGGHEQDLVDREPWKYIASAAKSPRFGPSRSPRCVSREGLPARCIVRSGCRRPARQVG